MYKFPVYIILSISSYLLKRIFFVLLNNEMSGFRDLLARVPQGSVLGPLLLIIFINDAPKIKDVKESIFADDKLMYTSSFRIGAICKRLQRAFDANKRYFHKWKIRLNNSKSEAIIFTRRRPALTESINCGNFELSWLKKVKYLGVVLDQKLTFGKHVNAIVCKAIGSLIKLYPILKNRHLNQKCKLIFNKSLIRSPMLYACPIWSLACQSNIKKLQIVQNKFLRIIGNFTRFTPVFQIHEDLNKDRIDVIIYKISESFFRKIEKYSNPLVNQISYDRNIRYKHKRLMHIIK